jgi:hypothetical protein
MTLLERIPEETFREGSTPVLETERLVLRAPKLEDVKAMVSLANDLRVSQNTARMPHPYSAADAETFILFVAATEAEVAFAVTLTDGTLIGMCGLAQLDRDAPELGYWFGVDHWGTRPRPRAPFSTMLLSLWIFLPCRPGRASAIRRRAGCWRSAASNGPALYCSASPRSPRRHPPIVSVLTVGCGRR